MVNVTAIFFFQEDEDYIAAEEVKVALPFSSCFLIDFLFPSFSITPYYLDWSLYLKKNRENYSHLVKLSCMLSPAVS